MFLPRIFTLVLFLALTALPVHAQSGAVQSFQITESAAVRDVQPYFDALSKADLDRYRFHSKSNFIRFENGLTVEIFSADYCRLHNLSIKADRLRDDTQNYDDGSFVLTTTGMLVEKKKYNAKGQ